LVFFANSYPLPFITISNETVINSDGITKNLINPNINSELNTTINKIVGYV